MVSLTFVSSSVCIWTEKVFREYETRAFTWGENGGGLSTVLVTAARVPGGEIAILSIHGSATTAENVSSPTKQSPLQMRSTPRTDLMGLGSVRRLLSKAQPFFLVYTDRHRIAGLELNWALYNSQVQPVWFGGRKVCTHLTFARVVQINQDHQLCSCFHQFKIILNLRWFSTPFAFLFSARKVSNISLQ